MLQIIPGTCREKILKISERNYFSQFIRNLSFYTIGSNMIIDRKLKHTHTNIISNIIPQSNPQQTSISNSNDNNNLHVTFNYGKSKV